LILEEVERRGFGFFCTSPCELPWRRSTSKMSHRLLRKWCTPVALGEVFLSQLIERPQVAVQTECLQHASVWIRILSLLERRPVEQPSRNMLKWAPVNFVVGTWNTSLPFNRPIGLQNLVLAACSANHFITRTGHATKYKAPINKLLCLIHPQKKATALATSHLTKRIELRFLNRLERNVMS